MFCLQDSYFPEASHRIYNGIHEKIPIQRHSAISCRGNPTRRSENQTVANPSELLLFSSNHSEVEVFDLLSLTIIHRFSFGFCTNRRQANRGGGFPLLPRKSPRPVDQPLCPYRSPTAGLSLCDIPVR